MAGRSTRSTSAPTKSTRMAKLAKRRAFGKASHVQAKAVRH
jgi:hypothetical protein